MATFRVVSPHAVLRLVHLHGFSVKGPGTPRHAFSPALCCSDCSPGAKPRLPVQCATTVVVPPKGLTYRQAHRTVYNEVRHSALPYNPHAY